MSHVFPVGKLPPDTLLPLLARYAPPAPGVVVGPGLGLDAAVLDLGDRWLVAKTDPITFASHEIGWYAVHVNANDVAALGATPRWFLATLLLPEGRTTPDLVETVFAQVHAACAEIGVHLVGGHTEITYGLDRPIVVGQMLGDVAPDHLVTAAGAQVGDALLLTKGVGLEGTALIAREKAAELGHLPPADLVAAQGYLHRPGISVVRDAAIATRAGRVHAMHDPTEGGVATGLREIAEASGVGLAVEGDALPVSPITAAVCATFGLAPLGLISSGALLISLPAGDAPAVVAALHAEGIAAAIIGRVVPADQGLTLWQGESVVPLPDFERDELARLF